MSPAVEEAPPPSLVPRPQAPYVEKDRCPFECCRLGRWITDSPQVVYANEGDTAHVAFRLAPGDTMLALEGNVHIEQIGEVLVTRAFQTFAAGDTLLTLGWEGEAGVPVWHRGILEILEPEWQEDADPGDTDPEDAPPGRLLTPQIMDWWVRVRHGDSEGWLRFRNRIQLGFAIDARIRGMDACG